jgi:hypothetical protein
MALQCDTIELLGLKIWHEHFVISSNSIIGRLEFVSARPLMMCVIQLGNLIWHD